MQSFVNQSSEQTVSRILRWMIGVAIVLFVLFLGTTLFGIGRATSAAMTIRDEVEMAQTEVQDLGFTQAQVHVQEIIEQSGRGRSGLRWVGWVQVLPWAGDYYDAAEALFLAAEETGRAFDEALDVVIEVEEVMLEAQAILRDIQPGEDFAFEDFPDDLRVQLLNRIYRQSDAFYRAATQLRLAERDLKKLESLDLHEGFQAQIDPFIETVPQLADTFEILAPLAQSLDALAGINQEKQWLLVFLNNTEIRPGGGFMGVYGLGQVRHGSIEQLFISDTYALDQLVESIDYSVNPPEPLATYMGEDKWYFRDANWSPDFPTSADVTRTLLRQEYAAIGEPVPQIDGVFGFTPTAAERILELTGPIVVDGIEFNSDNLTEVLEYEVEIGYVDRGIAREDRKAIVGELMHRVLDELYALPPSSWPALFSRIQDSFIDKQIAFYSVDAESQAVFEDAGWAGEVDWGRADDVFMHVDANVGALKTDHAMDREITYAIESDSDGYVATATIRYIHDGTFDYRTSRYRTYARVYAPLGSELLSAEGTLLNDALLNPDGLSGEVRVQEELGLTSFGFFTSVEPGQEHVVTLTYRLPDAVMESIEGGVYQLATLKQMGAKHHALTLDLDFGKTILSALPAESSDQFGDTSYRVETALDQDRIFTVEF